MGFMGFGFMAWGLDLGWLRVLRNCAKCWSGVRFATEPTKQKLKTVTENPNQKHLNPKALISQP